MPQVTQGGMIVVPVDIDTAHPLGSTGATEAILALRYNPQLFDVSAADVHLGSLTAGWQLTAVVNARTGEIGIDLYSSSPIQTNAGGSLVTITMHMLGGDAGSTMSPIPLTLVTQIDPTGQRLFRTTVSDDQGAFIIHFGSGLWVVGGDQFTAASTSTAPVEPASEIQFAAHSPPPNGHFADPPPTSACADLLPVGATIQDAALMQQDAKLDSDVGNGAPGDAQAPTWPSPADPANQTDWIGDDYLAYLRQWVKRTPALSGLNWPDDMETD